MTVLDSNDQNKKRGTGRMESRPVSEHSNSGIDTPSLTPTSRYSVGTDFGGGSDGGDVPPPPPPSFLVSFRTTLSTKNPLHVESARPKLTPSSEAGLATSTAPAAPLLVSSSPTALLTNQTPGPSRSSSVVLPTNVRERQRGMEQSKPKQEPSKVTDVVYFDENGMEHLSESTVSTTALSESSFVHSNELPSFEVEQWLQCREKTDTDKEEESDDETDPQMNRPRQSNKSKQMSSRWSNNQSLYIKELVCYGPPQRLGLSDTTVSAMWPYRLGEALPFPHKEMLDDATAPDEAILGSHKTVKRKRTKIRTVRRKKRARQVAVQPFGKVTNGGDALAYRSEDQLEVEAHWQEGNTESKSSTRHDRKEDDSDDDDDEASTTYRATQRRLYIPDNSSAPMRHILLGNTPSCLEAAATATMHRSGGNKRKTTRQLPESTLPKTVADTSVFDFHPVLSFRDLELAWLVEESMYSGRPTIDWVFVMDHASPELRVHLRRTSRADGTVEAHLHRSHYKAFQQQRHKIKSLLLQGYHRNRTIALAMAKARLQNRMGRKSGLGR